MELELICENCGKPFIMVLSHDTAEKYQKYLKGDLSFEEVVTDLDNEEQQMLKDHLCSDCLSYEA